MAAALAVLASGALAWPAQPSAPLAKPSGVLLPPLLPMLPLLPLLRLLPLGPPAVFYS